MAKKEEAYALRKGVCTWLTKSDYSKFKAVSNFNNLSMAEYLRAIIVDILVEEYPKIPFIEEPRIVESNDCITIHMVV